MFNELALPEQIEHSRFIRKPYHLNLRVILLENSICSTVCPLIDHGNTHHHRAGMYHYIIYTLKML